MTLNAKKNVQMDLGEEEELDVPQTIMQKDEEELRKQLAKEYANQMEELKEQETRMYADKMEQLRREIEEQHREVD